MSRNVELDEIIADGRTMSAIQLRLLGGFRAQHGFTVPESAWQQRRSAKALVKLMACQPRHSLHREQILEILWPELDPASALNSFGKALHIARRALEPAMPSRGPSSYLRLSDDVLSLVTDMVWIDIDWFEKMATDALRGERIASLEDALALYTGDLLPEDTYVSWTTSRRMALADLYLQALMTLADVFEREGRHHLAIERFNQVLQVEPGREDVHRRLMRLHAASGRKLLALRQYQLCRDALRQELDAEPESSTMALYEEIRADRIEHEPSAESTSHPRERIALAVGEPGGVSSPPLIGREPVLECLSTHLSRMEKGAGTAVFIDGPLGVGKSRIVEEVGRMAASRGILVLQSMSLETESSPPFALLAHALETYIETLGVPEQRLLAHRYPQLVELLPSLYGGGDSSSFQSRQRPERHHLVSAICRLLTDMTSHQPLLLIIEDVHLASGSALQFLHYLAHLAARRRLLLLCTYRPEYLAMRSNLRSILASGISQRLCHEIRLPMLSRIESDQLARAVMGSRTASSSLLNEVWVASSGNPFFILQTLPVLDEIEKRGSSYQVWHEIDYDEGDVPIDVLSVVAASLGRLGHGADRVLALTALAGPDVSFHELCLAIHEAVDSAMPETAILDILDTAVWGHLLEERGVGYTFTYALFGAAVLAGLSRQRRTEFHAAVAHAVTTYRPNALDLIAYHRSRSQDMGRGLLLPQAQFQYDAG